jgi:choline monooxygenase
MDGMKIEIASPLSAATLPGHYHEPRYFDRERDRIFSRLWIFAGLANELSRPNDFRRIELGGRDVIVQNCGGRLRAFINSCSHRHAAVQEERSGNRKLICPYHGWVYDDDGVPRGMPEDNFPQVIADPAAYALRQVELDCAGHFIFVRAEKGTASLRDYLGHAYEFLVSASSGLDSNMDEFEGEVGANWKCVIENALEGYHVPMIHRGTLAAIKQFSVETDDITDHLPASGHSYMVNKANPVWLRRWKRYERALGTWPFMFDHYIHQLIFPNLTVTSFMGYSFHIQRFHPDSVGRTSVESRIYSVRCDGQTEQGRGIMRAVYDEGKAFTRKVFSEDRRACELAFRGVQQAERRAVLAGHAEKRLHHFQRSYVQALGEAA